MRAEQVALLVFVAGCDQLLEAELLEVVRKEVEEGADPRVIAVEIDDLAFEVLPIVLEFSLYVFDLRVEFVFLVCLRPAQA